MPLPHPVTTRIAAALLGALALFVLPAALSGFFRGLVGGLDATARWPYAVGAVLGGSQLALGLAVFALTATTALLLAIRPDAGRFLAILAALAWLPFGCGVVSLAIVALAWFPLSDPATHGSAPPRPRTPSPPPASVPASSPTAPPSAPR